MLDTVEYKENLKEDIRRIYNELPEDLQQEYEYEILNLNNMKLDALDRTLEVLSDRLP